jgi:hypothetical protein
MEDKPNSALRNYILKAEYVLYKGREALCSSCNSVFLEYRVFFVLLILLITWR